MKSHVIGFPRMGEKRELKKALESFWRGEKNLESLLKTGERIKAENWEKQKKAGLSYVTTGDFSFYDHILDTSIMLGAIPERFKGLFKKNLSTAYFAMARGDKNLNIPAMDMKKWFNTNYHYIVPEFENNLDFALTMPQVVTDTITARSLGYRPKPVLTGPFTYLHLGFSKCENRYHLIERIVDNYCSVIAELSQLSDLIQIDEPVLCTDIHPEIKDKFANLYETVYEKFKKAANRSKLMVATYFGKLQENFDIVNKAPIDIIHLDCISSKDELDSIISKLDNSKGLSLGLINGRNIWRNNLEESISAIENIIKKTGKERLMVSSSSSLLHCPVSLKYEKKLNSEIKSWLAFADEKLDEISFLADFFNGRTDEEFFKENKKAVSSRKNHSQIFIKEVRSRTENIKESDLKRRSPFEERIKKQKKELSLPVLPTTTIGSFPQTKKIRKARQEFRSGIISEAEYKDFMKKEIKDVINFQEKIGLDLFVHGEPERNDMVEYFGENLEGFTFTENGWVQSYGSRCVKPPVIFGDVSRKKQITVDWIKYANSLTSKEVKGMLTGPVTILNWSFERDDIEKKEILNQIAIAIRDEVKDLEKEGIKVIQIDEAALREGLPLRKSDYEEYLSMAVNSFLLASSGVEDKTQIHTHMCYSEFNSIIAWIAKMDADVISIESSRSKMGLLDAFEKFQYPNEIGPGVYDIHSERIPEKEEIRDLIEKALEVIPLERLWVNPDCGLKTRKWPEVEKSLLAMVKAAKEIRESISCTA